MNLKVFIAVMVLATLVACHQKPQKPDVLLIVVDTLRWDHVGFNAATGHTPNMDRIAQSATVYSQCRSASSNTSISMASFWTGLPPHETGVLTQLVALPQRHITVAEQFQQAGYQTLGITANPVLTPGMGFSQGFDHYQVTSRYGPDLIQALKDQLETPSPKPRFIYVQFMDTHFPYNPGPFASNYDCADFGYFDEVSAHHKSLSEMLFHPPLDEVEMARAKRVYAASVRHVDALVGEIVETLRDPLLIITADHGESLGEHGYFFGHSIMTYEATIKVPLLIRSPGQLEQERIEQPVTHMGLHHALSRWLWQDIPVHIEAETKPQVAWGHPNLGLLEDNTKVPAKGILGARRSVFIQPNKIHLVPQPETAAAFEVYELDSDPNEQTILPHGHLSDDQWRNVINVFETSVPTQENTGTAHAAQLELLRSLGYVAD